MLAVVARAEIDRFAERHVHVDRAFLQDAEQMRAELDIARPGGDRPVIAAHGHAVDAGIGDRHRLDVDHALLRMRDGGGGRAEKRGLHFEKPVAVGCRSLGEEHDDLARRHAFGNLVHLVAGAALLFADDEDALLQLGERAEDRPFRHFHLGDEDDVGDRAEHQDILPGDMVGGEHQRPAAVDPSVDMDADAEQEAGRPVPVARKIAADLQIEGKTDQLERQDDQRDREKDEDDDADPNPGDHLSSLSSGMP